MGAKIPVWLTICRTYRFVFGRYVTVLAIVWLPALMLAVGLCFLVLPPLPGFAEILRFLLFEFIFLFTAVWMSAGIAKELLGLRAGSRRYYLPGRDELRLLGAGFIACGTMGGIAMLILSVAILVALLLGAIAHGLSVLPSPWIVADLGTGPMAVPLAMVDVTVSGLFMYVMLRVTWLLVPVVVAVRRATVLGGWRLLNGNVWRAFAVSVATWLPVMLLESVFVFVLSGQALFDSDPPLVAPLSTAYLPLYCIAVLLLAPVVAGLMIAPSAFSYRALAAPEP